MSKKNKQTLIIFVCIVIVMVIAAVALLPSFAPAATIEELQSQIGSHSEKIKKLEEEIKVYQSELSKTTVQAKNLQSAVQSLDTNAKKLSTDIKVTETKISSTDLAILKLSLQIKEKEQKIEVGHIALSNAIRDINKADSQSLLETMLTYKDLSNFWNELETLERFHTKVRDNVLTLKQLQAELEGDKRETEWKKRELVGFKTDLADQKTVIEVNKNEKAKLLKETKNLESEYKKIIADRLAKKKAFEQELFEYESRLRIAIDPSKLPDARPGVLGWPLKNHKITQYFGDTEFSRANAGVYNGKGHNGIDLAAPIGTSILSAQSGTVEGTGNTDTVCPNASYGKWVLVRHNNGLSTLYAHLSVIKVSPGQTVALGETIGYSGNTGYSTGPHLHFTVYATQGVQILSRKSTACGGTYTMPIADLRAYLDPLSYL